jgi:sortase A
MFKTHISKLLLVLLVGGIVVSYYSLSYRFNRQASFPEVAIPLVTVSSATSSTPVALSIPSLHISTSIESVGVTAQGAMDVPQSIQNVAWFSLGTVPGDVGSAIIGGHYGWKDDKLSAFDHLHEVRIGNLIYVTSAAGSVIAFKVREVRTYSWNSDAREIFISNDGKSHLNLITCAGSWDAKNHTYLERFVVFADKVE